MKETGRISAIHGKMITIHAGEIAACFGCMNQECRSNKRLITAENRNHFDLSVGQFVEIENRASSALMQFVQAILPPILGFLAAYFFVRILFPVSSNGGRFFAGVMGFFLAGFVFYQYRKKVPVKNNPYVIKVFDASTVESCGVS